MIRVFCFVFLNLILIFNISYSFSFDEFTAKLDVDKANRLFKKGDYNNAISLYEKSLSKITNSSEIYYNIATTMSQVGEIDNAIELFNIAKKNFNSKTKSHLKNATYYNSGLLKIEKQDYQGAIDDLINALVVLPEDKNSKMALEYALKKLKNQPKNSGDDKKDEESNNNEQNNNNNNSSDENKNNNQEQSDNKDKSNNENNKEEDNNNNNNEEEEVKADVDRILESLRQYRDDKSKDKQYYGGGRIDKDW